MTMHILKAPQKYKKERSGRVLCMGNFDGVHLGHQRLLDRLLAISNYDRTLKSSVLTFEPAPHIFFNPSSKAHRITSLRDKFEYMCTYGIDECIVIRFNECWAQMSADQFIEKVLLSELEMRHMIIGPDASFGHNRRGNLELLQQMALRLNFGLHTTCEYQQDGDKVSSTTVRSLLSQGLLTEAGRLLARSFSISGRVIHGQKRARNLGFPTANIASRCQLLRGVFPVQVQIEHQGSYNGIANAGFRPTFAQGQQYLLEVHLFNANFDLYGKRLRVYPKDRLREECKFESVEALRQQMEQDVMKAREYFNVK